MGAVFTGPNYEALRIPVKPGMPHGEEQGPEAAPLIESSHDAEAAPDLMSAPAPLNRAIAPMQRLLLLALITSCAATDGASWEPTVGLGVQTAGHHIETAWLSSAETAQAGKSSVDRELAELTFGVTRMAGEGEQARPDWFAGVKLGFGDLESSERFDFGGDQNLDELSVGGLWYLTSNPVWTPYLSAWAVSSRPGSSDLDAQTSLALGAGVEVAMGPQFGLYAELDYLDPLSDSDATGTLRNLADTEDLPASGARSYRGLALMFGIRARIGLTD